MKIRPATTKDALQITEIYNWYVLNTVSTFETQPVSLAEIRHRIQEKAGK